MTCLWTRIWPSRIWCNVDTSDIVTVIGHYEYGRIRYFESDRVCVEFRDRSEEVPRSNIVSHVSPAIGRVSWAPVDYGIFPITILRGDMAENHVDSE